MGKVRELAEKLWTGETDTATAHPLATTLGLEEYAPGLAFVSSFGNVTALDTRDGLVLFDTGSPMTVGHVKSELRRWTKQRVSTVVYTHGHVDHVGGAEALLDGGPGRVIAHEALPARLDRYKETAGYNGSINARQFRMPGLRWPESYRYPDVVYRDEHDIEVGGIPIQLFHDKGETDDSTWAWLRDLRALVTGDLFIWASPNCGNPQKVQRYPREWARALRRMAELRPALLFPGHGPPIEGEERVAQALADSAALLEHLVRETLARMNAGMKLDAILAEVRAPAALLDKPYLRPVYDEPEFVVRNLWRLYGGWYDGDPAHLKPPRAPALAREVAALSGGAARLAERARALSEDGDHAMACQLIEWARAASPDDRDIAATRSTIYRRRSEAEESFMAQSIFRAAADD